MELSVEQELEAAIARAMPSVRRIFGHAARMRWRGATIQVGFFSEYGFHVRGSALAPTTIDPFPTVAAFRSFLDKTTAEAIASVRRNSDDPQPK